MKFICLICAETVMEQMAPADAEKHFQEYAEFTADIKRNGHFIGANRLTPADTAITVRVRNGKVSTTDGPFAETKEQFGGYYLIEARDLNEAIQVAAKVPGARFGCVECGLSQRMHRRSRSDLTRPAQSEQLSILRRADRLRNVSSDLTLEPRRGRSKT